MSSAVTASDWVKGIALSILASIIGGASKLAIRKSWLMEEEQQDSINESSSHQSRQIDNGFHYVHEDDDEDERDQREGNEEDGERPTTLRRRPSVVSLDSAEPPEEGFRDEEENEAPRSPVFAGSRDRLHTEDASTDHSRSSHDKKRNCVALVLRGSGMIGMTFLNPICCVLAMNYASPSILAPFSGLTLVWIVLLSQPLIHERPSRNQWIAASLIILGQMVIALFGDHRNDEGVTVQDVRDSYVSPPFLLFLVALTAWMLLLWHWMHAPIPTTTNDGSENNIREMLQRFSWGASGGSLTGLQNFLKDSLTILKAVQAGDNDSIFPWYLPLLVVLAAGSAFGGLLFLTACMKRYDATYSSAMFVGSFVVSASIMSAVHYATFAHLESLWNWILYPTGLVVLMAGVWMLVHEQSRRAAATALTSSSERSSSTASSSGPRRMGPIEMQEPLVVPREDTPRS